MEDNFHVLDPDGDVVLILRNLSTAFAVWDQDHEYLPLPPSIVPIFWGSGPGAQGPQGPVMACN